MISGYIRDFLPRLTLTLPGLQGPIPIEFILDTGFEGDLALPHSLVARLDVAYQEDRAVRLADGSQRRIALYELLLDWDGQQRTVEVTVLEGQPLLGAVLLQDFSIYLEMIDGGEVTIEPL